MKKLLASLLTVLVFATAPVWAGAGYDCNEKDCGNCQQTENFEKYGNDMYVEDQTYANEVTQKATLAMLYMVYSDLNNCLRSYNQNIKDSVSAIGHLNNAQSALKKTVIHPAYYPLVEEINKRISKAKFYLVMNDRTAVNQRLTQLMHIIKNTLGEGNNTGMNMSGYSDYSEDKTSVPVQTEIPVGKGDGLIVSPIVPSVGGVVPVR
ncbi:MAG: hypothetical protein PHF29_02020 [Candidatus Riflebacteria bacterium]|nr:hypothetical protein [Candidatus Riflebacteria bacterium]